MYSKEGHSHQQLNYFNIFLKQGELLSFCLFGWFKFVMNVLKRWALSI